jgi:hypothetical protein
MAIGLEILYVVHIASLSCLRRGHVGCRDYHAVPGAVLRRAALDLPGCVNLFKRRAGESSCDRDS